MSDSAEYKKLYDNAHKCYRNKSEIECKTDANLCNWYPGYYDKFCYPESLNKNGELTTGTGIMGTSNSIQLNMYNELVAKDVEHEKEINSKIDEIIKSIEKRIEGHRLINNFLYYLTTYEKINLLDNNTMYGTILMLLVSSVNNILKENGMAEITVNILAPKLITIIKNIREIYERWKFGILIEHREVLEKTYTLNNSSFLAQIDEYFTNVHMDGIFGVIGSSSSTFNGLRKNIGEYLYDILYERTLGQESYAKQILVGTIKCGLRVCTNIDLKQVAISKLLPLFGLETDEEFLQYIHDLIKPRYSDGNNLNSKLYDNEYMQLIENLNNKIKSQLQHGGKLNHFKNQYNKNKNLYIMLKKQN